MYLINNIKKLYKKNTTLFTTPGHSRGKKLSPLFRNFFGKKVFQFDFSEIDDLDNLQNPTKCLKKSLIRTSSIYGSKESFYLVNGSSSGIIALFLASLNTKDKVLMPRNIHKSVINALTLSGAEPIWLDTEWDNEWDIPNHINIENIKDKLNQHPDIKVLLITNPTYEGIITDIKEISDLCKKEKITFIVDEAHGALWNFNEELPAPAILNGADASVQSLHKTASALTQCAILHVAKDSKIDINRLQNSLNLINTTSPSFILLSSIEAAIEELNQASGKKKITELLNNIQELKDKLIHFKHISFLNKNNDKTKIFFKIKGFTGYELADILYERFNIEVELCNNIGVLALTGIGTDKIKLDKLYNAILKIKSQEQESKNNSIPLPTPITKLTPREAFYSPFKAIKIKNSIGYTSKETIVPYPPGIPILIAGEIIQECHLEFLKNQDEIKVIS